MVDLGVSSRTTDNPYEIYDIYFTFPMINMHVIVLSSYKLASAGGVLPLIPKLVAFFFIGQKALGATKRK